MQPKDYDSTLARIAGNIAAGMCGPRMAADAGAEKDRIAGQAVALAIRIVNQCRHHAQHGAPAPRPPEAAHD